MFAVTSRVGEAGVFAERLGRPLIRKAEAEEIEKARKERLEIADKRRLWKENQINYRCMLTRFLLVY